MTELAQATGYSWASHPWLNENASYHRMVYEDRSVFHSFESFHRLFQELIEKFRRSNNSRFLMRMIAKNEAISRISDHISHIWWTPGIYPNLHDEAWKFSYVTIGINRPDRNPSAENIAKILQKNREYITKIQEQVKNFEDFSLGGLHTFESKGFRLAQDISARELQILWTPFWWSKKACENLLQSSDGSFALGVRNKNNELVSSILYSHQPHNNIPHWEMTELTTLPEFRGQWIASILATALQVKALHKGIMNIYGEFRALSPTWKQIQSIKCAIESGMEFFSSFPLVNHVDIDDFPDAHNIGLSLPGYPGNPEQLKSFFVGSLNPEKISPRIREAYGNILSL